MPKLTEEQKRIKREKYKQKRLSQGKEYKPMKERIQDKLTPEEKKKKAAEYSKNYYRKKKEKEGKKVLDKLSKEERRKRKLESTRQSYIRKCKKEGREYKSHEERRKEKQHLKDKRKAYYIKYKENMTPEQKERLKQRNKEYYQRNKDKIRKKRNKKPIQEKNNYIKDIELRYELILSKGKGTPTNKLHMMVYEICEKLNRKFNYHNENIRHDIIHFSYLHTIENFYEYNEKRYTKALPYISELIKRSQTKQFNQERYKGLYINLKINKDNIEYHSISDVFNF